MMKNVKKSFCHCIESKNNLKKIKKKPEILFRLLFFCLFFFDFLHNFLRFFKMKHKKLVILVGHFCSGIVCLLKMTDKTDIITPSKQRKTEQILPRFSLFCIKTGRSKQIRTAGLLVPNQLNIGFFYA